jgi:hypothetical protein
LRLFIIAKCNERTGGSARGEGGFWPAAMSGGVAARCARQMLNLVPEAFGVRAATRSSALIVSWFPPVHVALARHHNRRECEFWGSTLDAAGPGAAGATLGRRHRTNIALRLPADLVIEHPVTLPSAAERHLHGVLGYEMDRLTLAADKVFWAAATESRDRSAGRLALRLAIRLKAGLRSLLLARWELVPPLMRRIWCRAASHLARPHHAPSGAGTRHSHRPGRPVLD